jgi:hypothetical protein
MLIFLQTGEGILSEGPPVSIPSPAGCPSTFFPQLRTSWKDPSLPSSPAEKAGLAAEDGSPCLAKGESAASGAPYPKNGGGSSGRTEFPKHASLIFPARKTV